MTRKAPISHNIIELLHRISLISLIVFVCAAAFCGCVSAYSDNWTDFADTAYTPQNITYYGSNNTFVIHNNYGLAWVAKDINAGNNNTSKFILDKDINLTGHDWTPIGTIYGPLGGVINYAFRGTFDGCGHTISNLYINNTSAAYHGLFGYAQNANFTNVSLTNVSITGFNNVGGLVGYIHITDNGVSSTIKNCNVTGNVSEIGCIYACLGGLIGGINVNGVSSTITIENCYAAGYVSNCKTTQAGTGGLIGHIKMDPDANNILIKIKNCYATGDVGGSAGSRDLGGLIGEFCWNNGVSNTITIENCYATGDVGGSMYDVMHVGGLIGEYTVGCVSTIENCYTTGDVCGGRNGNDIGGLIGNYEVRSGGISTIKNCYATGDVNSSLLLPANDVGGLIGSNVVGSGGISTIENCYAAGDVSDSCKYFPHAGGLIGFSSVGGLSYVKNSTALNQYVNSSSFEEYPPYGHLCFVGRIYGFASGTAGTLNLLNNYAWDGMTNYSQPFTENIGHDKLNGSSVSNKSVWCNESFFKNTLHWDFTDTWAIESADDGNCYPLPYLKTLGRDGLLREKVIHLRPNYIVTFNNNTGDGIMYEQIFPSALPQNLIPNKFSKRGYSFTGWNTNADESGTAYTNEHKINITNDLMLYALWKPNITKITLEFNNSSTVYKNETVSIEFNNSTFSQTLTVPAYAGHGFMGYNNSSFGGVTVINSELKLVKDAENYTTADGLWNNTSESITLWAVWESDTDKLVNVTFNPNNDSVNCYINQTVVKHLSTALIDPGFTRDGYKFIGWNNTSCGDDLKVDFNVSDSINISADTTLWAVWDIITPTPTPIITPTVTPSGSSSSYYYTTTYIGGINYEVVIGDNLTVFFNSTGGSHVDNQTNLHYGDKVKEPKNPTKDGYIFDAWYTANAYKWDFKNDTVNKSFTLYANWTAIPEHNCCWFWIILLIIAGVVITAVIIKIRQNKKEDYEKIS